MGVLQADKVESKGFDLALSAITDKLNFLVNGLRNLQAGIMSTASTENHLETEAIHGLANILEAIENDFERISAALYPVKELGGCPGSKQMKGEMKMTRVTVSWADNKEDFLLTMTDGEWIVTKDNELYYLAIHDNSSDYEIKDRFLICGLAPHHTTDWLRFFCDEHHPEVNFDKEFETDTPGVFARYQERFGDDYLEGVAEMQYEALEEELTKLGYELHFDKDPTGNPVEGKANGQ